MAVMVGNEMATVSHLQSRMKYAISGKLMKANVQERLSITPTSFLCSMLTHSTSDEEQINKSKTHTHTHHFDNYSDTGIFILETLLFAILEPQ